MDRELAGALVWTTRDLIDRCYNHDARAWDEFVQRYNRVLSGYVFRACRLSGMSGSDNQELMRDLVQDIYSHLLANDCRVLKAWRGETEESLRAYLSRVASTVTCDAARYERAKKRSATMISLDATEPDGSRSIADQIPAPEGMSPDRIMTERLAPERLAKLLKTVCSGPNGTRDALIFQLHAIHGLTASEIAAMPVFSMQVSTVESILRRTRDRLRKAIDDPEDLTG